VDHAGRPLAGAVCPDCNGTRTVAGVDGGYNPCPSCVIDAGWTFVSVDGVDY
jgi:hypothetical protein